MLCHDDSTKDIVLGINIIIIAYYLRRRLASGEGTVSFGVRLSRFHAVCVSAALVLAAKVMRCMPCCLVIIIYSHFLPWQRHFSGDSLEDKRV